jgi:type VI secretion system secreted protein VgrG
MPNFDTAFNITLKHEGGYVDTVYDKGGETKYGISKARYPNLDIANLTLNQAKDIYKRDFWNKFRIGDIHDQNKANLVFDMVVLHGYGIGIVQRGLRKLGRREVEVDNRIGSITLKAINQVPDTMFINYVTDERRKYFHDLVAKDPSQQKFLKGWLKRADFFLSRGKSLLTLMILGGVGWYLWQKTKKKK